MDTGPPRGWSRASRKARAYKRERGLQGMPRQTEFKQTLCADIDGFSLHAAVRCAADDRQTLEQLCRYITRPALAKERVPTNAAAAGGAKAQDNLARRPCRPPLARGQGPGPSPGTGSCRRWSSCSGWQHRCQGFQIGLQGKSSICALRSASLASSVLKPLSKMSSFMPARTAAVSS